MDIVPPEEAPEAAKVATTSTAPFPVVVNTIEWEGPSKRKYRAFRGGDKGKEPIHGTEQHRQGPLSPLPKRVLRSQRTPTQFNIPTTNAGTEQDIAL
jgi:hypothetical protein